MIRAVERGEVPELPAGVPEPLVALLRRCWALDPAARPSADEVVAEIKQLQVTFVFLNWLTGQKF